ncbi:hypothetical protein RDWZM_005471 [Blomia tropicalis]|uniref:SUMO-activating enzyme subunit n=1 Tax=Blomia tropicalis TaxID=40697 RepID=A0A9Q0M6B7_BLOTA|nr:hypothetical protein RDWZM_005471 [Blomia tropicalis]
MDSTTQPLRQSSNQILDLTLGDPELVRRIKSSNILLVGAGGIGCEVLKGLLLAGFEKITIIDLDTIDVSNLNRQFLYNKTHVGQSKAVVAASVSVERFSHRDPVTGCPISVVKPIHDSILKLNFNRQYYQQFTFVINALDNNTTRVHVNRMCLAADIPLIESASASYNGNIRLIKRNVTQCFECLPPKKDENTYASCTIRNTPSLPIHCIVWAKHLFAQLFGQTDEDISPDVLYDPSMFSTTDSDEKISQTTTTTTREYVESTDYDPKALFEKIFYKDILYLKKMGNLWTNRKSPRELLFDQIASGEAKFDDDLNNKDNNEQKTKPSNSVIRDQEIWSMSHCFDVFCKSLSKLKERVKLEKILEWDKDDDIAVDFVASVSNFRSYCFFIPRKSKFEVKSLAGNIIPAISSTNTIVGGYIILQTFRLLSCILPERIWKDEHMDTTKLDSKKLELEAKAIKDQCFLAYITNKNYNKISKVAIEELLPPIPNCLACSSDIKEIIIAFPLDTTTLGDFIEQIVKKKFKTIAPDISVFGLNKMLWAAEDEDDVDDTIRGKLLSNYSFMTDNVCLLLQDLEQNFEVRLLLRDMKFDLEENDGEFFKILNQDELDTLRDEMKNGNEAKQVEATPTLESDNKDLINLEDNDLELIEQEDNEPKHLDENIVPNDDDFEIIEMSELNEIELDKIKSSIKRSGSGSENGDENDCHSAEVNGKSNLNQSNNSIKRIRTN